MLNLRNNLFVFHVLARLVIVQFQAQFKWNIPAYCITFVSFQQMLEFYEDHEEALKVLNDYAYDSNFPPNPNAHVYLYQYLKRRDTSERKLMKVLKVSVY